MFGLAWFVRDLLGSAGAWGPNIHRTSPFGSTVFPGGLREITEIFKSHKPLKTKGLWRPDSPFLGACCESFRLAAVLPSVGARSASHTGILAPQGHLGLGPPLWRGLLGA